MLGLCGFRLQSAASRLGLQNGYRSSAFRSVRQLLRQPPKRSYHEHYRWNPAQNMNTIWGIIGANTLVFGAWRYAHYKHDDKLWQALSANFLLSRQHIEKGRYWAAVTSAFSHIDVFHFIFNMFALHTFGTLSSWIPFITPAHMTTVALGSAICGSLGFLAHQSSRAKTSNNRITAVGLGASGMVLGFGAAAATIMPHQRILLMGIVPAPLWLVVGGYLLFDLYYLDDPRSKTGHAGHVGGTAFGLAYAAFVLRRLGRGFRMGPF